LSGSVQTGATGKSGRGVLSFADRVCLTARAAIAGVCARALDAERAMRATALQHIVVCRIATPL
jgi:hypothetical protein